MKIKDLLADNLITMSLILPTFQLDAQSHPGLSKRWQDKFLVFKLSTMRTIINQKRNLLTLVSSTLRIAKAKVQE